MILKTGKSLLILTLKEEIKIDVIMITENLNKENVNVTNKYFSHKKECKLNL